MNLYEEYLKNKDTYLVKSDTLDLISVKYVSLGVDWANELTRQARGLVINSKGDIIARPFEKFFNLRELENREVSEELKNLAREDEGEIAVYDKLDGSLVIAFYSEEAGKLTFASSGMVGSEHSEMFEEYAEQSWDEHTWKLMTELSKEYTLLFEFTSPSNQIVLIYTETKLTMLGMINTKTGEDLYMDEIKSLTEGALVDYAQELDFTSLDEVKQYIDETEGIEGVIVRFKSTGKRVKLKTEEYFELHRIATILDMSDPFSKKSVLAIADMLLDDREGDLYDLLSSSMYLRASEEFHKGVELVIMGVKNQLKLFNAFASAPELIMQPLLDSPSPTSLYGKDEHEVMSIYEYEGFTYSFTRGFLVSFLRAINSFRTQQDEYLRIHAAAKGSKVISKINEALKDVYGTIVNYRQHISYRSFAYKEYVAGDFIRKEMVHQFVNEDE